MYSKFHNNSYASVIRTVLVTSIAALLIAGCSKKEEAPTAEVVRPVKMIELQSGRLQRQITLPGQIFPARQANMAFEVPGRMTDIYVTEGQEVSEGQLLAKLDPRDYQAALDAAGAQLETARIEADRAQSLYESQATSKQRLDLAVSNFKVAQAAFDRAEKAFEDTSLVAPISGFVAKVFVNDIVNVSAKQDILIIQDNSTLKVTVDIPETLSVLANTTMTYEERTARSNPMVYLTSLPNQGFPARISEVAMTADPSTRTYEATLVMKNPADINILPGMTTKVVANMPEGPSQVEGGFIVPVNAVGDNELGDAYVYLVSPSDMTVQRQSVKLGNLSEGTIEIFSDGLSAGDLIVTSGVSQLRPGQQVRKLEN